MRIAAGLAVLLALSPLRRRRGAAQLRSHTAERSVLERRGQFRRSQQRRRERHHFRALVVGRAALREAARVLSRDGDLRAQARAHDDGDGAWIRGNPGRREQVFEQLLRLDLRLQQRRLARHPGCRLSRNRHLLVREPEGQGGSLDQASHLRTDRQRIADLRRHDRRRRSRARLHHQGTLRLRADGRAQSRHAVDVSPDFAPTTSTATSRTALALATSTATGGSTCSKKTAGGNSRRR